MSLFRYNPEIHDNPEFHHHQHGYDPNQPRVPKGHSDGGQWTSGAYGGGEGTSRANVGASQVRLAFVPPPLIPAGVRAAVAVIGAGLAYLAAKSQRNSRDQQAVVEFRAYGYRKEGDDPKGKIDLSAPAMLGRSEVEQSCKALRKVQEYTDEAVKSVNARELRENKYMSASQYGTAVHKALKDIIEALKSNPYNLSAEVSFAKTQEVKYGTKDSIRIDVHEPLRPITLCVYDIKTGDEARNIVSPTRAAEIAKNMTEKGYIRLLITEIRSRVPRNPPF